MLQQMENIRRKEASQLWLPSRSYSELHLERHLGGISSSIASHWLPFTDLMAEMTLSFEVTPGTYKSNQMSPFSFPLNFYFS